MNDQEIFDSLGVPEDRRDDLAAVLHAWAKWYIPGPNMYAVHATLLWRMMNLPPIWDIPEDTFDPSGWITQ